MKRAGSKEGIEARSIKASRRRLGSVGEFDVVVECFDAGEVEALGHGEAFGGATYGDGAGLFVAQDHGGDVDDGFVDEALVDEGAQEARAGFDEDVGDAHEVEALEEGAEVDGTAAGGDADELDLGGAEGVAFFGGDGGGQEVLIAGEEGGGGPGGLDEFGAEGYFEIGVGDDAKGDAARARVAACGEEGVVGEDGAEAREDGVDAGAEAVDAGAGAFAADPFALAGAGGDSAVDGLGPFGDDPREARGDAFDEGGGEACGEWAGEGVADAEAGGGEGGRAAGFCGVGIGLGVDDFGEAFAEDGVDAGGLFALSVAGLEGDVHGGATGGVSSAGAIVEGLGLGVGPAEAEVVAQAEDLAVARDDGADEGVGLDAALGAEGEAGGEVEEAFVEVGRGGGIHGRGGMIRIADEGGCRPSAGRSHLGERRSPRYHSTNLWYYEPRQGARLRQGSESWHGRLLMWRGHVGSWGVNRLSECRHRVLRSRHAGFLRGFARCRGVRVVLGSWGGRRRVV